MNGYSIGVIDRSGPFGADPPMGTRSGVVDPAVVSFLLMRVECGRGVAEPRQWIAGDMRNLERHLHGGRSLPRQGTVRLVVEANIRIPDVRTWVGVIPNDNGPLVAREEAPCIRDPK